MNTNNHNLIIKQINMKTILLKSGYSIPVIGLGTWLMSGRECFDSVLIALENGYRHIDTASAYENEDDIGQAIKVSGLNRKELFLTSKVWYQKLRYKDVIDQCNSSLEKLGTDYLDLLLIHWPNKFIPLEDTFKAFERLIEEHKVHSIGVSNFTINHLSDAIKSTILPISVNQIEFHPFLYQKEILEYCMEKDIVVTAYSPLARGKVFESDLLQKIAQKKECSPGQITIAWLLKKGMVAIPKSSSEEHIIANLQALSINLTEDESAQIDSLTEQQRFINPSWSEFDY